MILTVLLEPSRLSSSELVTDCVCVCWHLSMWGSALKYMVPVQARNQPWHCSSAAIRDKVCQWNSGSVDCTRPQGSTYLCLPRNGMTSTDHGTRLVKWVWGLTSGPQACTESTLGAEQFPSFGFKFWAHFQSAKQRFHLGCHSLPPFGILPKIAWGVSAQPILQSQAVPFRGCVLDYYFRPLILLKSILSPTSLFFLMHLSSLDQSCSPCDSFIIQIKYHLV